MTNSDAVAIWEEVVRLAEIAFRQTANGGTPDRDVSGALAERVLSLDAHRREEVTLTEIGSPVD